MDTIIVTGGMGYIGSHTMAQLIRSGYHAISIDSHINSSRQTAARIEQATGVVVKNHVVDLCDKAATEAVISEIVGQYKVKGVIHFAALKSVPESVEKPLLYYHNNILSMTNLLGICEATGIRSFIFSSSCSVYGNVTQLPVNEQVPHGYAESPYAYTKQVCERILGDYTRNTQLKGISLRYFNPVGADHTALIGEDPINPPTALVPIITQVAAGRRTSMTVHGSDYNTRDGSCVRDYIHVTDLADAHIKAIEYLENGGAHPQHEIFNLGTGNGISVLEAIEAFEKITGLKLNYSIGPRRAGDVEAIYSDTHLAKSKLGWEARIGIEEMMRSAWEWEKNSGRLEIGD